MPVRQATYNDWDGLYKFIHKIEHFKPILKDANESKMYRTFASCLEFGFAKVVTYKGKIVGCSFGAIHENHWGRMCAFDILNYSTRETPQLLRLFHLWAKEKKADDIYIANTYGSERYERLIQRMGFKLDTKVYRGV